MPETLTKPLYAFDEAKHLHALDGVPLIGTTTALSVIAKPLTWWSAGMAVAELGWLNPKKHEANERLVAAGEKLTAIKEMTIKEYLSLLDKAYRAHSQNLKKTADKGVDLHAMIEEWIKWKMGIASFVVTDPETHDKIQPFIEWSEKNVRKFLFSELHCYSKVLHVGGIADFGYEDMAGNYVLGDIKSSREAYFSQWAQLGGYDIQIGENGGLNAKGELIFDPLRPFDYHAIFCAGASLEKPFFNHEPVKMKDAFCHAVSLYKSQLFYEKEK